MFQTLLLICFQANTARQVRLKTGSRMEICFRKRAILGDVLAFLCAFLSPSSSRSSHFVLFTPLERSSKSVLGLPKRSGRVQGRCEGFGEVDRLRSEERFEILPCLITYFVHRHILRMRQICSIRCTFKLMGKNKKNLITHLGNSCEYI